VGIKAHPQVKVLPVFLLAEEKKGSSVFEVERNSLLSSEVHPQLDFLGYSSAM